MKKRFFIVFWVLVCFSLTMCKNGVIPNAEKSFLQKVVEELNYARTKPTEYATKVLELRLSLFEGTKYKQDNGVYLITNEGATAVQEAINALKAQSPLSPLTLDETLCKVSHLLAEYQAATGVTGHVGPSSMTPEDRINQFGTFYGTCGENCAYGPTTPREIVAQLIIDDGVDGRGHRKNIFKAEFKVVGVAYIEGEKAAYGSVCVMDFATGFSPNDTAK